MDVSCQCGQVHFTTKSSKPLEVYCCHCTECRKQSSSAFGISAKFPANELFPLSDDMKTKLRMWSRVSDAGNTIDCWFCSRCGARIVHRLRVANGEAPTMNIKGGLIEGLDLEGASHIWTKSAVVPIPPGAERHEKSPPPEVTKDEPKE